MTALHDRVVPTKPDGYHLVGVVIGLPDVFDRQFYSINFDCADGTIENLWLTENEFVPLDPHAALAKLEGSHV